MREPGPRHPIVIAPHAGTIRVRLAGEVVARTDRAWVLREAGYPPVFYLPREAVDPARLARNARTSFCPYKGRASHYDLNAGGATSEAAAWSYETPFPAVSRIRGHLAFYPERVEAIDADGE